MSTNKFKLRDYIIILAALAAGAFLIAIIYFLFIILEAISDNIGVLLVFAACGAPAIIAYYRFLNNGFPYKAPIWVINAAAFCCLLVGLFLGFDVGLWGGVLWLAAMVWSVMPHQAETNE
jgi:hypothetical protein